MKKILTLILALMMVLSLAACGDDKDKDETNNVPLKRDDAITNPTAQMGEDIIPGGISDNIDFASIIGGNGDDNVVWGNQDEATKQAIINEAKKEGLDVSFANDGSMVVVDPENGDSYSQKSDGTWVIKNEEGGEGKIGGDWPENEFTALVPKPDFTVEASNSDSYGVTVVFSGVTMEQIFDYAEKVKTRGFTINPIVYDLEGVGMSYSASNADGYFVCITSSAGTSAITITK